jgi:hypothetical protein
MKNIKLIWQLLAVVILCTSFTACGDDDEDEINIAVPLESDYNVYPITRDILVGGTWKFNKREDVFDNDGFSLGTKEFYHEIYLDYSGSGWERSYGWTDSFGKQEDAFDTGQQEITFKYKQSTEKDSIYGVLAITNNGTSRTIIVTRPNDNVVYTWNYRLFFDGIAYRRDVPQPDIPDNPGITPDDNSKDTLTTIDGYEFVDLGLSVKWAASNLNGYYQYGNPSANDFKTEYGLPTTGIGGTSDDPAYANMSNKWRLPTRTEMQELVNNCTWEYTYDNGSGFRVTGPNGNSIFLTCDGAYPLGNESSLLYYGYQCWLMTSTLDNSGNKRPYILKASYINSYTSPTVNVTTSEAYRISGMSVRGVSIADPDVRNK